MEFLSYLIPGILVGFIYALIALGFVLIFKASGVLNIATGHFAILGGYVAWSFTRGFDLGWWAAFPAAIVVGVLLGLVVERFALRPLVGEPIFAMMMMTLGLMVFLEGVIIISWGAHYKSLPKLFPGESVSLAGTTLPVAYLGAGGVAIFLVLLLAVFFKYTKWGLAMRESKLSEVSFLQKIIYIIP